jgi:hypothetical protein
VKKILIVWIGLMVFVYAEKGADYWVSTQRVEVYNHQSGEAVGFMSEGKIILGTYDRSDKVVVFIKKGKTFRILGKHLLSGRRLIKIGKEIENLCKKAKNLEKEGERYEQLCAIGAPRTTNGRTSDCYSLGSENYTSTTTSDDYYANRSRMNYSYRQSTKCLKSATKLYDKYNRYIHKMRVFLENVEKCEASK